MRSRENPRLRCEFCVVVCAELYVQEEQKGNRKLKSTLLSMAAIDVAATSRAFSNGCMVLEICGTTGISGVNGNNPVSAVTHAQALALASTRATRAYRIQYPTAPRSDRTHAAHEHGRTDAHVVMDGSNKHAHASCVYPLPVPYPQTRQSKRRSHKLYSHCTG